MPKMLTSVFGVSLDQTTEKGKTAVHISQMTMH
jgi:hypothetical protein